MKPFILAIILALPATTLGAAPATHEVPATAALGKAEYYVTTTSRSVTLHFKETPAARHVPRGKTYKFNSTTRKLKLERIN